MLVYHMVLSFMDNNDWYSSVFFSVVDNNGWYSNLFCLSWAVIVGIASDYVSLGQLLLVYPVLSVIDDIGWYISHCVVREQYWLVYQPVLSVVDNNGWFITQICLSWTILVIISPSFVCHGQ